MSRQARSRWVASVGGALLALTMSSVALAAPAATTATYVDANGNRIDDSCETNVVPDPVAAAASFAAADLDHDGTISEAEALQAGWIGSENCVGGGDTGPVTPPPPAPTPTPPTPAPGPTNPPKADDGSNRDCAPRRSHGSGHRHHHGHGHGNGGHHHGNGGHQGNSRNGRS